MQVRPGLRTAIRRMSWNLISLVVLGSCLSLLADTNAFSQALYLRQEDAGQQAIRVWKVGSPHTGDVPDSRVPAATQGESGEA